MQKKADEAQREANNKLEAEQRKNIEQIAELIAASTRYTVGKAVETRQAMDRMRSEMAESRGRENALEV